MVPDTKLDSFIKPDKSSGDPLIVIMAKKYAEEHNIPVEQALQVLESIREKKPDLFESLRNALGIIAEFGDKIGDPALAPLIQPLIDDSFRNAGGDGIDDDMQGLMKTMVKFKMMMDTLFGNGDKKYYEIIEKLEKRIEELENKLEDKKRDELIERLEKKIEELEERLEEASGSGSDEGLVNQLMEQLNNMQEQLKKLQDPEYLANVFEEHAKKAEKLLKMAGYHVEKAPGLTPEELKKIAEKYGLKLENASIPMDEYMRRMKKLRKIVRKKIKEAFRKGYEKALEELDAKQFEKQLEVLENIIIKAIDTSIQYIFGPLMQSLFSQNPEKASEAMRAVSELTSEITSMVRRAGSQAGLPSNVVETVSKNVGEAVKESIEEVTGNTYLLTD